MKKMILILILCSAVLTVSAQNESKAAVDKFISLYNEQKFDDIYDSFASVFQEQVPRQTGTGLLSQVFGISGKLGQAVFISLRNGRYNYLLKGQQASIALEFNLTDKKLDRVRISPGNAGDAPPALATLLLKTDNSGSSAAEIFINNRVVGFEQSNKTTGLEIGVLANSRINYYGYGETVRGNGILPSAQALFDIGSVSKTFTAYILASLVNENKLTLDTRLDKYFTGLDPKVAAITIVQLANHSSGLPNMGTIPMNGVPGHDPNELYEPADLENDLRKIQLLSVPGTKFNYSNFGFSVLGNILEKAGGEIYQQLLDRYILRPNKMTATFYKTPLVYAATTMGYDKSGEEREYLNLNAYGPAGNIKSTAEDLLKYAQLLMSRDKAAELVRNITFSPQDGNKIGLSWIIIPMDGKEFYFHNGATIGYRSYIALYPAEQKALVILNNSAFDVTNLGMQIMQYLLK